MQTDIEQLKRSPQCLRVYSNRIRLEKRASDYFGLCPFHGEKTPSFSVFLKDQIWLFQCFGCGKKGNCLQLVQEMDGITFKQAIAKVQEEIGDRSWEESKDQVDAVFRAPVSEPEDVRTLTLAQIGSLERALDNSEPAKKWLAGRGISLETAKALHIGFKQDLGRIAYGLKPEIVSGGWMAFPYVEGEKVVGIKFRSLREKTFRKQPQMATTLYNLDDVDPLEPVYLVEGEPDSAVMKQAGLRVISLPSGSINVTPEMRDQMMAADHVILAGDCDGGVGSQIMERLRRDLGDRSFLLQWPDGKKDANQTFLETCKGDVSIFRTLVEQLTVDAKGNPMPEFTSIQKALMSGGNTQIADHPHRLRLPWPGVDHMAVLLPGSVLMISATNTSMGKSQFVNQICVHAAQEGEVVVNYQVEMSPEEIATITAAHVTRSDRNELTLDKNRLAAKLLRDARYYVGNDPSLTTPGPVFDLLEKAIRRLGATVVVLDHIHFLCRGDNEIRDQAEASRRMKLLAQQYRVKFIVVGQPRKADSKSKGKVLHITDLKGSASLGDDIDAFFVLHRSVIQNPDPNNPPMDLYEPKTEVHCLKARSKGRGAAYTELYFHGSLATHTDITHMEPPA